MFNFIFFVLKTKYTYLAHSPITSHQISLSSPNSPTSKNETNSNNSLSRGRQLWNIAVDSVLDHEKTPPLTSSSMVSSTVAHDPAGWYNLTKR
jgi:hypothetical protein